jgi:hypothetical protein
MSSKPTSTTSLLRRSVTTIRFVQPTLSGAFPSLVEVHSIPSSLFSQVLLGREYAEGGNRGSEEFFRHEFLNSISCSKGRSRARVTSLSIIRVSKFAGHLARACLLRCLRSESWWPPSKGQTWWDGITNATRSRYEYLGWRAWNPLQEDIR